MKKITALILALAMVFAITACDNGGGNSNNSTTTTPRNNTTTQAGNNDTQANSNNSSTVDYLFNPTQEEIVQILAETEKFREPFFTDVITRFQTLHGDQSADDVSELFADYLTSMTYERRSYTWRLNAPDAEDDKLRILIMANISDEQLNQDDSAALKTIFLWHYNLGMLLDTSIVIDDSDLKRNEEFSSKVLGERGSNIRYEGENLTYETLKAAAGGSPGYVIGFRDGKPDSYVWYNGKYELGITLTGMYGAMSAGMWLPTDWRQTG